MGSCEKSFFFIEKVFTHLVVPEAVSFVMKERDVIIIGELLILCAIYQTVVAEKPTKGAYKMTLDTIKNCSKSYRPLSKTDNIKLNVWTSKKGHIQGDMIVKKNNIHYIKFRSDTHMWEDGKWNLLTRFPGWTCDRKFIVLLLTAMDVRYDKNTCSLKEGTYHFRNLDVNYLAHGWVTNLYYGKLMSRAEFLDSRYTYVCVELEMTVKPLLS
ncbi:hypothetical protein evm_008463 [Chilo suppressalis]|nr:hypothetical protein evm_008463 [Chilo suppressalis]